MKIRKVAVEFLRAGPRNNQLLSPLTQYLGVCGNAPAGVVRVPYEHREIDQRLQELRYESADDARRQYALDKTAREIAGVLSQVPSLAGVLNREDGAADTLTHLRIVLSASELAMLPFELSKTPTGAEPSAEWLALQARRPICMTRHIRSASAEGMRWPTDPRILLAAGPDTPVDEHEQALTRVLQPWRNDQGNVDHRLLVLRNATRAGIEQALARAARDGTPFSHVHILAHGVPLDERDPASPVGVDLEGETLSGERLALVLTAVTHDGVVRPAVVTLAMCDSGKLADVRTVDASVAHDLHDHGIPLVVASQFPLSVRGSVPFVERFYAGQLDGEHPLVSLYDVRLALHRQFGHQTHDWASLVVYEALPADFEHALEELRYWQMRRAQAGALKRLEARVPHGGGRPALSAGDYRALVAEAATAGDRLPEGGPYALECAGLRAAGHKRLGQAALELALAVDDAHWRDALVAEFRDRIERARTDYWRAAQAFLSPGSDTMRSKANLHWPLGQVLSVDAILGRPFDVAAWTAARMAARIDTESGPPIERAWGFISLSEQSLLRLDDASLSPEERARHARDALESAEKVVELLGRHSEHVETTTRQYERYATVWGNPRLAELGIDPHAHWNADDGLVPTAMRIVRALRGHRGGNERVDEALSRTPPVSSGVPASERTLARRSPRRNDAHFSVEMLPAENGDCLWIEYGDERDPSGLLVDCGATFTAATIAARIAGRARPLDLFVLTHIDADHINGVLPLFEDRVLDGRVGDVWFNGWKQLEGFLSVQQGEAFSRMLGVRDRELPWNRALTPDGARTPAPVFVPDDGPLPAFELPGGMRLTLLSPGPEDLRALGLHWKRVLQELQDGEPMLARRKRPQPVSDISRFELEPLAQAPVRKDPSVANGSSIAFLAEFDGRSLLLTGDAHAGVLAKSLARLSRERGRGDARLAVDAVKLSHHGSMHGTTTALLERIDCPRWLVSTNGKIFYHPDREAIARVVLHGGEKPTLCFNYRSEFNGLWDEPALRARYRYEAVYPEEGASGLRIAI